MNKILRVLLLPVVLGAAVPLLPGCGGGSSSVPTIARFAGTYNGTFSGTVTQGPNAGQPVSGTFSAVANSSGIVTGTFTQAGFGTVPASGTISNGGDIVVSAAIPGGQTARLNGTVQSRTTGDLTVGGTFTTTQSGTTVVSGTFSGARVSTTAN